MKHYPFGASLLCCAFVGLTAYAAELPPRETIEKDGWTIEFSPRDRVTAEQFAARFAEIEQIRTESQQRKIELEPSVIDMRAVEFARKSAELCALPERSVDFKKEISRMLPTARELLAAFGTVTSPRAISLWWKSELIQRLHAGERLPALSSEPGTTELAFKFGFKFSIDKDYAITERPAALTVLPLVLREEDKPESSADVWLGEFKKMNDHFAMLRGQVYGKMVIAVSLNTAISNTLASEIPKGSTTQWIQSAATQWTLRRLFVHALNPELAESYLWYHEKQLQIAFQAPERINLEENPESLSTNQQAAAYAVFRTIAEKHGNEAVTKLLAAFWKLKPAQRTSQAFAKICAKQLKQPLSAYLPRGVVIEPVAEKTKK